MAYDTYSTVFAAVRDRTAGWETTLDTNWENISPDKRDLLKALIARTVNNAGSVEVFTASDTLTDSETGKTCFLNAAGGFTITLPAPAAGLEFEFIVKTAPTGAAYIIAAATADTIMGKVIASTGGDEDSEVTPGASQINLVAATSRAGDRVVVRCDGTYWYADCFVDAAGAATFTG